MLLCLESTPLEQEQKVQTVLTLENYVHHFVLDDYQHQRTVSARMDNQGELPEGGMMRLLTPWARRGSGTVPGDVQERAVGADGDRQGVWVRFEADSVRNGAGDQGAGEVESKNRPSGESDGRFNEAYRLVTPEYGMGFRRDHQEQHQYEFCVKTYSVRNFILDRYLIANLSKCTWNSI